MPRDTLLFVALGVTALGGSSDPIARHAVAVSAPAVLQVPEIVVSGPPEVGSCDDVVLFASGNRTTPGPVLLATSLVSTCGRSRARAFLFLLCYARRARWLCYCAHDSLVHPWL
eukprot:263880-Rhodomonas_salina.2